MADLTHSTTRHSSSYSHARPRRRAFLLASRTEDPKTLQYERMDDHAVANDTQSASSVSPERRFACASSGALPSALSRLPNT